VFGAVTNNGQGDGGDELNCRIMLCALDPEIDNRVLDGVSKELSMRPECGAHVINCRLGLAGWNSDFFEYEQDIVTAATRAGALVVTLQRGNSKGQNLDQIPFYPASYDHVLSVGATEDTTDAIADFSNLGLNVLFAPGRNIRVALDNGSYGTDQSTSAASPLVAGLAGLLKAAHPEWTPEQIAEQISYDR